MNKFLELYKAERAIQKSSKYYPLYLITAIASIVLCIISLIYYFTLKDLESNYNACKKMEDDWEDEEFEVEDLDDED